MDLALIGKALLALGVMTIVLLVRALLTAPEGYEDDECYHDGKRPKGGEL